MLATFCLVLAELNPTVPNALDVTADSACEPNVAPDAPAIPGNAEFGNTAMFVPNLSSIYWH
jgi:hypothetical protein